MTTSTTTTKFTRASRRFSRPLYMASCTESLMCNEPGFVELSFERFIDDHFDIDEFIVAMKMNCTVKHVCFTGGFVRECTPEQWNTILYSVSYLVSLEQLQIWGSTIPVNTFTELLLRATNLRTIFFFHTKLDGTQQDFIDFSNAIKNHENLSEFRFGGIDYVTSANNHDDEPISFDCVIEALGLAPQMKVVKLQLMNIHNENHFTGRALTKLLQSKTITCLYLTRLHLQMEHYNAIAAAIPHNTQLRILDLFANNIQHTSQLLNIINALGCPTGIHGIEMVVLPGLNDNDFNDECSVAIANMIKVNTSIMSLYMPCSKFTDIGLTNLAESLLVNTTLKKIEISISPHIGPIGKDALTNMLEQNYELERLIIDSNEMTIQRKIEYYIRLNAVGRGQLINSGQANRVEWVNMIISVSDDLDCIYYFMCMNPTLCQYANTTGADVIITEEYNPPSRRHSIANMFPFTMPVRPKGAKVLRNKSLR